MIRVFRWADVPDEDGIIYRVEGDWEPLQPSTETEPAEGGCFYEYFVVYNHEDFTEKLDKTLIADLVLKAEEKLNAMDRGEL